MIGKLTNIQRLFGGEWVLSFSTTADAGAVYDKLKDTDVDVEIKKHNPKRSRDANNFRQFRKRKFTGKQSRMSANTSRCRSVRMLLKRSRAVGQHMERAGLQKWSITANSRATSWFLPITDHQRMTARL